MEALGESTIEKAVNVMKQLINESIAEEEEENKLYKELDGLLEGVDFEEPMSPQYISPCTEQSTSVHISSQEVSNNLKTYLHIFLIKIILSQFNS